MSKLRFITDIYSHLYSINPIVNRLYTPLRFFSRLVTDFYLDYLYKDNNLECNHREDVIVSLTSFPARIENIWKVIVSLKQQECTPKKVLLWLSECQFDSLNNLPSKLLNLQDDIFEIRMVKDDLKSHKKYYYAMREYPDESIITVDDDIIYHPKTLLYLLESAKENRGCIVANITSILKYDNHILMPYDQWESNKSLKKGNIIPIGAGGVFYPPHCLDNLLFRKDLFMSLAPKADDLWLNAMSRLSKTPVVQSKANLFYMPVFKKTISLNSENVGMGLNDTQLASIRKYVLDHYGVDIFDDSYAEAYS